MSMRSGASVIQERADSAVPRAARMIRGFTEASMGQSLGRKRPDIS